MTEIKDTEIRILGSTTPSNHKSKRKNMIWLYGILLIIVAVAIGIIIGFYVNKKEQPTTEPLTDSAFEPTGQVALPHPFRVWIEHGLQQTGKGCLIKDTMVNDIPLVLKMPIGCKARLETGYECLKDTSKIVLLCQAADVRADNKKIVGAFVKEGKPLSWGLSKKGYCGIINDTISVGVAENSPLFEKATETGGYFFRQYPLVSNGMIVENELKTKSTRRALCEIEGAIVVIETQTRESLHDFSQALVDIGVRNAIYLVGSSSIAYYKDINGKSCASGEWKPQVYDNISFIIWE